MKQNLLLSSFFVVFFTFNMALFAENKDPYEYPKTADDYQLENVFLKTSILNSDAAVFVSGAAEHTRGMAVKDGKMYFSGRKNLSSPYVPQIYEIDGATGELLNTFDLPAESYGSIIHPANDIAIDAAGNMFVANLITQKQEFRISYIDISKSPVEWETILSITPETNTRLETFSVFGDVKDGDGFIMIPVSASKTIWKYNVEEGVVADAPEKITINYTGSASSMSSQARIHIVSDSRFYVDGGTWDPALYGMDGKVIDGFQNNTALAPTVVDATTNKGKQNGVVEFELNGKYYLFTAYTCQNSDKPGQFALFEFKDSDKAFEDMTLLYRFPEAGMGAFSDGASLYATIPQVEIIKDGEKDKARLYIYSWKNGYGIYDFGEKSSFTTSISENKTDGLSYNLNNRTIELSENAGLLCLYNTSGQKIQEVANSNTIIAPANGIFLLEVRFENSVSKTIKVIVP